MKGFLRTFLIAILILTLAVGLFACKKKPETAEDAPSLEELSVAAVTASIPEGKENAALAAALLSLLERSGLEESEIRATLSLYKSQKDEAYATAFLDLKEGSFSLSHALSYRAALQVVANAVSPEIAGEVYFTVASGASDSLPYTLSDCRKLASVLLAQDAAFGTDTIEKLRNAGYTGTNERQVTTALRSLAASLSKATGISREAKEYLYNLAAGSIDEWIAEGDFSEKESAIAEQGKTAILSLAALLRDHYDLALTYGAAYLSASDARLLLGLPYERRETVIYYGYDSANWKSTEITKAEYDARSGGYDDYYERESTVKGFTVNGSFQPISEGDAALAERVYRLSLAYRAYETLSAEDKAELQSALPELLTILSKEQSTLGALLDRPLIEKSDAPAGSLSDLLSALPALASFDATDGISETERCAADATISAFESYLHGYLPYLY